MEEGGNKAAFREAVQMSSQAATSGVSKVVTSSFSTDGAAHTHTHTDSPSIAEGVGRRVSGSLRDSVTLPWESSSRPNLKGSADFVHTVVCHRTQLQTAAPAF